MDVIYVKGKTDDCESEFGIIKNASLPLDFKDFVLLVESDCADRMLDLALRSMNKNGPGMPAGGHFVNNPDGSFRSLGLYDADSIAVTILGACRTLDCITKPDGSAVPGHDFTVLVDNT